MARRTLARVASRTPDALLITRETVPTPTPEAAATSAMVARRDLGIATPSTIPNWNRFHGGTINLGHAPPNSSRLQTGISTVKSERVDRSNLAALGAEAAAAVKSAQASAQI